LSAGVEPRHWRCGRGSQSCCHHLVFSTSRRVWGALRSQVSGLRSQGSGPRAQGPGPRAQGSGPSHRGCAEPARGMPHTRPRWRWADARHCAEPASQPSAHQEQTGATGSFYDATVTCEPARLFQHITREWHMRRSRSLRLDSCDPRRRRARARRTAALKAHRGTSAWTPMCHSALSVPRELLYAWCRYQPVHHMFDLSAHVRRAQCTFNIERANRHEGAVTTRISTTRTLALRQHVRPNSELLIS